MRKRRYKYDVALSFAEEDRPFVRQVAEALRGLEVRYFYDGHERVRLLGKRLDVELDRIYREDSRFCIVFLSKDYKEKHWTQFEKHRALARSYYAPQKEYLLPFRLDATSVEGISKDVVYLSRSEYSPEDLAAAVATRVQQAHDDDIRLWLQARSVLVKRKWWLLAAATLAVFLMLDLFNRLTPVHLLAQRLHDQSGLLYHAVCRDGKPSQAKGSGACSSHGGVDHKVDTVVFTRSLEQCLEEARSRSLIPE